MTSLPYTLPGVTGGPISIYMKLFILPNIQFLVGGISRKKLSSAKCIIKICRVGEGVAVKDA